jgi:hypothetical protein
MSYAAGLRTQSAQLVRGSSRRITIMRFRPANIRVINRRDSRLDRDLHYFRRTRERKRRKHMLVVDRSFHIRTLPKLRAAFGANAFRKVTRAFVPKNYCWHGAAGCISTGLRS